MNQIDLEDAKRPVEDFIINAIRSILAGFLALMVIYLIISTAISIFDGGINITEIATFTTGILAVAVLLIAFRIEARITDIRDVLILASNIEVKEPDEEDEK